MLPYARGGLLISSTIYVGKISCYGSLSYILAIEMCVRLRFKFGLNRRCTNKAGIPVGTNRSIGRGCTRAIWNESTNRWHGTFIARRVIETKLVQQCEAPRLEVCHNIAVIRGRGTCYVTPRIMYYEWEKKCGNPLEIVAACDSCVSAMASLLVLLFGGGNTATSFRLHVLPCHDSGNCPVCLYAEDEGERLELPKRMGP